MLYFCLELLSFVFKIVAREKVARLLLIFVCSLVPLSCASMILGKHQRVPVSSEPVGADVYLNGELMGKTPIQLDVKRKVATNWIRIELEGYEPYTMPLDRLYSYWGLLDVLLLAPILWTKDAVKFEPKEVHGILQKVKDSSSSLNRDQIYFSVTLNPQGGVQVTIRQ